MKHRTLPVKRTPVSQGILKRLAAVTRSRKQRVAATADADEIGNDDHSSKISRALTIIFLIHIVVIGLIFFHQKFLDDGAPVSEAKVKKVAAAPPAREHELPKFSDGSSFYAVKVGDNYPVIAERLGIEEADLREVNGNVSFGAGALLRIPPKKIVAVSPELAAFRQEQQAPAVNDSGLVEAVPVGGEIAPRAVVVKPNTPPPAAVPVQRASERTAPAAGTKYVVQAGDNIWRISNRFKVDQNALMKANNISDPKKLKLGMTLVIPR